MSWILAVGVVGWVLRFRFVRSGFVLHYALPLAQP